MTRGQLKTNLRVNLADLGVVFYSEDDLNESIQDAYDDIAVLSQCILKVNTLSFQDKLSYYDFSLLGINDYLGCTAIFNNQTNTFLRDDLSLRDFDRIRRDWENWLGQPQYWAPSDPKRIAIVPKITGSIVSGAFDPFSFSSAFFIGNTIALGTFDLYYWATAPALMSDSDTFLIATDMQDLLESYVTGDMLEQAQEFSKAQVFWDKYYPGVADYAERVKNNVKSDLLMRV